MDITNLQLAKDFIQAVCTWPFVAFISILSLRQPIIILVNRFVKSEQGKAKIGIIEIELGKLAEQGKGAIFEVQKLNHLMAQSRLLELEITKSSFGAIFTEEQNSRMNIHIDEINKFLKNNECKNNNPTSQ